VKKLFISVGAVVAPAELIRLGIDNLFLKKYGSQQDLLKYKYISAEKIFKKIKKEL